MDEDSNFICDICDAKVSFLNFVETKVDVASKSGENIAEISGNMPENTKAEFSEVSKTETVEIINEYNKNNQTLDNESIIAAFDISLSSNDVKYQPNEFRNTVDVKISNLELDTSKTYAMLHVKEDGSYELLPVSVLNENEIKFKARSFSTYILITVEGRSLSFNGNGNYTIQDENGNEITNGTTVASGTNFTFVVVPNAGYVVTSITCTDSAGENQIILSGNGANVTGKIAAITEDLTVNIETILEANLTEPIDTVTAENMVTEWTIPAVNTTITLPVTGEVDILVDWGDGSEPERITGTFTESNMPTHTYTAAGTYDIKIKGTVGAWGLNSVYTSSSNTLIDITADKPYYTYAMYLTGLKQWGELGANSYGFSYCENLKYVIGNATEKTFENVNNMKYMFSLCSSLTNFDASPINTSKVTDMEFMFRGCSSLTNLDLSSFNTSKVTNMANMFKNCETLTSLNISNFNTSNVVTMAQMFYDCYALASLNLSSFNTSKVTNMPNMFSSCKALTSLDLSNFNTSNVKNMSFMFYNCTNLKILNISSFNTSKVTTMRSMFNSCNSLTSLDLSNFNTSNVTNMMGMFGYNVKLTSLNLSSFNTSNTTNMEQMFNGCQSLTSLDLSNFDTTNVTTMMKVFYNCSALTSLNVSSFNTANVTDMSYMFYQCKALEGLDVSNFNTSKVTNMNRMFSYDTKIETLDLSNFDTSKVTDMGNMFADMTGLKSILISNKFTVSATNVNLFRNDTNLKKIILTSSDATSDQFANASSQISNITFYVPNAGLEDYKNTWSIDDSDANKIQPIIQLNGLSNMLITTGSTYTEKGHETLTETMEEALKILPKEYSIVKTGNVDTTKPGTYELNYYLIKTKQQAVATTDLDALGISGDIIAKETRTVIVEDKEKLMITEWTIPAGGATITLPVRGSVNITVDWGDGTEIETITGSFDMTNLPTHIYQSAGTYDIKIKGTIYAWGDNSDDRSNAVYSTYQQYLTKVKSWGEVGAKRYIFYNCTNLNEVPTTASANAFVNLTDTAYMFRKCTSLTSLDLSYMNTSNVTTAQYMFSDCSALTSLNIDGFNLSKSANLSYMFLRCSALTELDLTNVTFGKPVNIVCMFAYLSNVKTLYLKNLDTSNCSGINELFAGCSSLTSLDISHFNTSKAKNMLSMFYGCSSLTSLDLSNFNTEQVTSMVTMFSSCSSLTSLNLSSFNTEKVTEMHSMFNGCTSLTSLDLSNFNTEQVTKMGSMFSSCSSLTSLNLSSFNTEKVTKMDNMFNGCKSLTTLDLSNFNTANVTDMSYMFYHCDALESLDLSSFNTANVTTMNRMFGYDDEIETLDLSSFDTTNVTDGANMFADMLALKTILINNKFTVPATNANLFRNDTNLTKIMLTSQSTTSDQFKNASAQIGNITFYVPNSGLTSYKNAWSIDDSKIKPILSLNGDDPMIIQVGGTYTEPGYKVAEYTAAELASLGSNNKNLYGYNVAVTGTVTPGTIGNYEVKYKLTRTYVGGDPVSTREEDVANETRDVKVHDIPNYIVNGEYYSTLEKAYAAIKTAGTSGEIIVNQDVPNETGLTIETGYTVTLNTQNSKVTFTNNRINVNGTLTIDGNGTLESAENANQFLIHNLGTLNVNNSTIIQNGFSDANSVAIYSSTNSTTNIYGGTILSINSATVNSYAIIANANAIVNIYGGTVKTLVNKDGTAQYYALWMDGQAIVNLKGGTIETELLVDTSATIGGAYINQAGTTLNVDGGTIKIYGTGNPSYLNYAVALYGGTVNVKDGNVLNDFAGNTNGIVIACNNTNSNINISGGNVIGKSYYCIHSNTASNINITGGKVEGGTYGIRLNNTTNIINIGTSGDAVSTEKPEIIGGTNAIKGNNPFNFYDGVLKGKTAISGTQPTPEKGYAVYTQTIDGVQNATLRKTVAGAEVTLSGGPFTYDGKAKTPAVTVKWNGTTLTKDTHYTVTYANNTNAGTATVTVTGKGDYTGTVEKTFTINPAPITGTVTISGTLTYGSKLTPTITGLNPSDATVTYEWFSNSNNSTTGGTSIGTSKTEQLTADSFNKYVYVVVTATKENYETTKITSNVTSGKIGKRPITVTAASATKVFDGTPLTNPEFTVSEKMAISSHSVKATITSSITNVGSVANTFDTVIVENTSGSNVSKYYTITTVSGTLTVTRKTGTASVSITGTPSTGETLTANVTKEADGAVSYQWWYSDSENATTGTAITGATSSTYIPTFDIEGKYIGVTVSIAEGTNYTACQANAKVYVAQQLEKYMITEWTIPTDNTIITLPVTGAVDILVDWGDGTEAQRITGTFTSANMPTHTYAEAGVYDIKVKGSVDKWGMSSVITADGSIQPIPEDNPYYGYVKYITGLKQWGELGAVRYKFTYCENLKYVNGNATENTFKNINDMTYMFYGCKSLETLDFGEHIDTSKVTSMPGMFWNCTNLKTLDLTKFETPSLNNTECMFYLCTKLENIYLSEKFDTSNVTNMNQMFVACYKLKYVDVSHFNTSNVTKMIGMFRDCNSLENLDVSGFDTSKVTSMSGMFEGCKLLTNIDVSDFVTSSVTSMSKMFYNCIALQNIDVSKFDTTNVTSMANMFSQCIALQSIDVSSFNTAKVTDMSYMFNKCNLIKNLDVSGFDTSKVENMTYMFYQCNALESLDVSNFNTSKVTNMNRMFSYDAEIQTLDLSNFDTSKVTDMGNMFANTTGMTAIQVSDKFVVAETNENIFRECNNLTAIITTSSTPVANQFKGTIPETTTLYVPNGSESAYAATLSGDTDAAQIAPIIQANGDKEMLVLKGSDYTDAGYTVAGFTPEELAALGSGDENLFGYNVVTTGDVKTDTEGIYNIDYSLTRTYKQNGTTVTTTPIIEKREVEVADLASFMITEWKIPADGTTIILPVRGNPVNIYIDWGDGTTETVNRKITASEDMPTHTYEEAGVYDIKIKGSIEKWGYNEWAEYSEASYTQNITGVKQWGELGANSYHFSSCTNLKYVSGNSTENTWNNLSNMDCMFYNCSSLASLDFGEHINTSKVNSMIQTFYGCSSLTSLDLSKFNTSNVTNMMNTFGNCSSLTSLDLRSFNTSKVTSMESMFSGCKALVSVDLSSFNTPILNNMGTMFAECPSLKSVDLSSFNTPNLNYMRAMFYNCKAIETIKFGDNFNTSKVKKFDSMFQNCYELKSVDVSGFDTSSATLMTQMFYACNKLEVIDVSNFDTTNVTSMDSMFQNCKAVKNLDVSGFNTSNVTDMSYMFYNCNVLESLDLSSFDTSNVTNMNRMFGYGYEIETLDLSSFDTENVTDGTNMFADMSSLKAIQVSEKFVVPATNENIFRNCSNLSAIITTSATPVANQFKGVIPEGVKLYVPNGSEDEYAATLNGDTNASQIAPVIQVNGDKEMLILKGSDYTDAGYLVAGFTPEELAALGSGDENLFGYNVVTTGEVKTDTEGIYNIDYSLTRTYKSGNTTVTTTPIVETREVEVADILSYMITEWTIPAANTTIKLPVTGAANITVDWGDGTEAQRITGTFTSGDMPTHKYAEAGVYDIQVKGTLTNWGIVGELDDDTIDESNAYYAYTKYLTALKQWGELGAKVYSFQLCENLKTVSGNSTENTWVNFNNMASMFENCSSLTSLDFGEYINTSNVTTMSNAFRNCSSLTSLDISKFNTDKSISASWMFGGCSSLKNLNIVGPTFSNVYNATYMFNGCSSLTSLDLSTVNPKRASINGMFSKCSSLTSLDLSNFDTSGIKKMAELFHGCSALKTINFGEKFSTANVNDSMNNMFSGCSSLTSLDLSGWDVSKVTKMENMFLNCKNLTDLNLSGWNTQSVTTMKLMFANCTSLTTLDLSSFNTGNVQYMNEMFSGCTGLKTIDVSNFNTENVTNMSYMFYKCNALEGLDVSNFNTSKVTNMNRMFSYDAEMQTLDLSNFDTSKVTDMGNMFANTTGMTAIQVSDKFVVAETNENIFRECNNLTAIITTSSTPVANQFKGTIPETTTFYVPNGSESAYAATLSGDTDSAQIAPIIQANGDKEMLVLKGSDYTDAGYTVAGFTLEELAALGSGDENLFGYNVVTTGEVKTDTEGVYSVDYELTRTYKVGNTTVTTDPITETREVEVADLIKFMITEWTIPADNTTITLPVTGTVDIYVDWGDGNTEEIKGTFTENNMPTHTYAAAGTYDISIKGTIGAWGVREAYSNNVVPEDGYITYRTYLTGLKQWGDLGATSYGFSYCTNLKYVDGVATENTFKNLNQMYIMFYNCKTLESIEFGPYINTSGVTSMQSMFRECNSLKSIDLSGFDTENVIDMNYMFMNCSSINSINLEGLDTHDLKSMNYMFRGCSALSNIDLSSFSTENVEKMEYLFTRCGALKSIDLSNFNTKNVDTMRSMFYECNSLESIKFGEYFDTSKVTTMYGMFYNCDKLTSLDLTHFNTSKVTDMQVMFSGCDVLESVDVTSFDTSKVTTMQSMFSGCSKLTSLDLSSFDTQNTNDAGEIFIPEEANMISNCTRLEAILISNKFVINENSTDVFTNCNNLSAVITTSAEPVANQFKGKLPEGVTLYVPNGSEDEYISTLNGDTNATQIAPIIQANGDKEMLILKGSDYTDAGYTVAGFTPTELKDLGSGDENLFGYNVVTTGDVKTDTEGIYNVDYSLTRTYKSGNTTVTTTPIVETREVEVADLTKYMITEWTIPAANTTITLPVTGAVDIYVDWGDGSELEKITGNFTESNMPTHTYAEAGTYDISIKGSVEVWGKREYISANEDGTITIPQDGYTTYRTYLTGLKHWGDLGATSYGFSYCTNLKYVDGVATENTFDNVTSMEYMFRYCTALERIDLSNFETTSVTNMSRMFARCSSLKTLDFSAFDTTNVTNMSYMFYECGALTNITFGETFKTENVTSMLQMFWSCSSLTSLDLSGFNTSKIKDMSDLFCGCKNLTSLDLSNFNTSSVTNMNGMFADCNNLTNLDLGNFNTSSVTDMNRMFSSCSKLTSLDLSSFNTQNVTTMISMFYGCTNLTNLDLSSFNTQNVTNMRQMFMECWSLTSLDLSSFNTQSVTTMRSMFNRCYALESLDLSNFTTPAATELSYMFKKAESLETVDLSGMDLANANTVQEMFYDCKELKAILVSNGFVIPATNTDMFTGATKLSAIITTSETPVANQFGGVIPDGAKLYVPNGSEEAYVATLNGDTNASQIAPILEPIGNDELTLLKGTSYEEKNFKVAGFGINQAENYLVYGYNPVTISGDVNTNKEGTYNIEYTLTRTYKSNGETINEKHVATRTINVVDKPNVVFYENGKIYNGEWTSNSIVGVLKLLSPQSTWIAVKIGNGEWGLDSEYVDIAQSGDQIAITFEKSMEANIYVREIDASGQATTYESLGNMVRIDKDIPEIKELKYVTEDGILKIKAKVTDETSGVTHYQVTQTNSASVSWEEAQTNEIIRAVPSSGTYYLMVKDAAGNIASSSIDAKKDITPPKGMIEIEATNIVSGDQYSGVIVIAPDIVSGEKYTNKDVVTINIIVTDNETMQEQIMFALYNEEDYAKVKAGEKEITWQAYTPEVEWQLKEEQGKNTIYAIFKDVAGNTTMKVVEY